MKAQFAATILLLAAAAQAQTNEYLYPIREGRKFGFINRAGAVVVPPRYDAVGDCREGRVRVTTGQLSGYIDYAGREVVPPKYDTAGDFRDGRAVVRVSDKYSLIDPAGKLIAEIPFRVLGEFHQGLLRVQAVGRTDANGKRLPTLYGFVDRDGKVAIPPQFMPAGQFPDDPANLPVGGLDHDWVYFDRTGKIVIRISMGPHLNDSIQFADGRLRVKEGFTWGFMDNTGKWAIAPKFDDAGDFKDGMARVEAGTKVLLIDVNGKEVPESKRKFQIVGPFADGLELVRQGDLMGWVDKNDRMAFPLRKYDEAHDFSCGRARFKLDDGYGFLDKTGYVAIPNRYLGAADFDHDLALVETRDGLAYIDTKGAVVWQSSAKTPGR